MNHPKQPPHDSAILSAAAALEAAEKLSDALDLASACARLGKLHAARANERAARKYVENVREQLTLIERALAQVPLVTRPVDRRKSSR